MNVQIEMIKNSIACLEKQLKLVNDNAGVIIALETVAYLKNEVKALENVLKAGE